MPDAWSKRSPERRQQLIAAAMRVISEHGLEATTTRRVAAEAGVSLGTVHYVFANKDDLIHAVIDSVCDTTEQSLSPALQQASASEDPELVVRRTLEHFWDVVENDETFQLLQFELMLYCIRRPEARWMAQRQQERYLGIIVGALAAASHAVDAGNAATLSMGRLVLAGIDGIVLQFLIHQDRGRARQDLANLTQALRPLLLDVMVTGEH